MKHLLKKASTVQHRKSSTKYLATDMSQVADVPVKGKGFISVLIEANTIAVKAMMETFTPMQ